MKKQLLALVLIWACCSGMALADHTGDYYDNRDANHAQMSISQHPGVTYMSSGYGAGSAVIEDKVVIGNASLAVTSGDYWGSLSRVNYLRYQSQANRAYDLYINNNAYWYPEHRDHDDVDYYFSQTPTMNNSQGSSGSEIDEMHKWFYTLDAFDTSTKTILVDNHILIPTMQYLARRSRVSSDNEYLTGIAHPNAFDNASNQTEMVALAAAMQAGEVPPIVKLEVTEENYNLDTGTANIFESTTSEIIYNTPVSIARAFHGHQYTKRIVVSAEDSYDVNGLPITYHWAILRGDNSKITINPLNSTSSEVEILIDYHPETVITGSSRKTNLVSIGAFVHNGHHYSAPAFVTSYTKRNETRTYNSVTNKLESIEYDNDYLDVTISLNKTWDRDEFHYDNEGELTGWTRFDGTTESEFTKEGYVIEAVDSNNMPTSVSRVYYSKVDNKTVWTRNGAPFDYPENYCTSWTYTEWSECQQGTQTRSVVESFPSGCTGGNPIVRQDCTVAQIHADVDQNGVINSTDAMLTLRNSLGLDMSNTNWQASSTTGDVNCDDTTNSTDAMLILRQSLGLDMGSTGWCVN